MAITHSVLFEVSPLPQLGSAYTQGAMSRWDFGFVALYLCQYGYCKTMTLPAMAIMCLQCLCCITRFHLNRSRIFRQVFCFYHPHPPGHSVKAAVQRFHCYYVSRGFSMLQTVYAALSLFFLSSHLLCSCQCSHL